MIIRIGLENGYQGRSLAWALDYPGCFAYGPDGPSALLGIPRALLNHRDWTETHAGREVIEVGDFDLRLVETWEDYSINRQFEPAADGYEVNAWFRDDWRPLSEGDVQRGVELLTWSRADLLQIVRDLPADLLDRQLPDERWSIRGVLGHVGGAEWWYLDRLGLGGERSALPRDAFERLGAVRTRLLAVLPELAGSKQAVGVDGEFWSPRKLLRRALWHELDHIGHIAHLI
jgi:hypothetical protein